MDSKWSLSTTGVRLPNPSICTMCSSLINRNRDRDRIQNSTTFHMWWLLVFNCGQQLWSFHWLIFILSMLWYCITIPYLVLLTNPSLAMLGPLNQQLRNSDGPKLNGFNSLISVWMTMSSQWQYNWTSAVRHKKWIHSICKLQLIDKNCKKTLFVFEKTPSVCSKHNQESGYSISIKNGRVIDFQSYYLN